MENFCVISKTVFLALAILEYVMFACVTGQTTTLHEDRTYSVCSAHLCQSTRCETPSGSTAPCRCDYACAYFGDCCVDSANSCSSDEATRFMESVQLIDRSQVTCLSLTQSSESYWLVSKCPGDWEDGEIRSKCEDANPSMITDIDAIPVSHGNALGYKNIYCALCNRIESSAVDAWRLEFLCPPNYRNMILEGSITLPELLQEDKCTSSLAPPLSSSVSAARSCELSPIIRSCPGESNVEITDLCSRYHGIVSDGMDIYGNPYCLLCNTGRDLTGADLVNAVEDLCQSIEPSTRRPPDPIRPTKRPPIRPPVTEGSNTTGNATGDRAIGGLQPLSIIMDFSRDGGVLVVESRNETRTVEVSCPSGQVFDHFTQECLTLSCAEGYELRENSCHRLLPPLNLTCGMNDADLIITLTATIARNQTESDACLSQAAHNNITMAIETILSLPTGSLQYSEQPIFNGNDTCLRFVNDSLDLIFTIDPYALSYSEIEEKVDTNLIGEDPYLFQLKYSLEGVAISQQCMSIVGLDQCKGGLMTLLNAEVVTKNGTMYVHDNQTDQTFHSYETVFQANYKAQGDSSTGSQYRKSFVIQTCNQPKLQSCSLITQNVSLFEPVGDSTNSLNNTMTGEVLRPHEYILTSDGNIRYCAPDTFQQNGTFNETFEREIFSYDEIQQILSFIGVSISLLSLLITFVTYCIFSHLRRCVSNKLITVLCLVLFLAQLLQMLSGIGTSIPSLCTALSAVSHFLWITVFALTTCLAFELDRTLGSRTTFSLSTDNPRAVLSYFLFTITVSSTIVGTCLAIHFTVGDQLNFSYGSSSVCWLVDQRANLVALGCPLGVFMVANVFLFAHTVTGIRQTTKVRKSMLQEAQTVAESGKELRVYLKISTLLGFTWLFGFIAGFAGVDALWYIFIILNSLQGFYIFLAFMANRRVLGMWLALLCECKTGTGLGRRSRGNSSLPLSTRLTRLTSISSLPRGSVHATKSERRNTNDYSTNSTKSERRNTNDMPNVKGGGKIRSSGVSQKVAAGDRRISADVSNGDRKYSGTIDRDSPANDRRFANGDKKVAGDRRYITASESRRYSNTMK